MSRFKRTEIIRFPSQSAVSEESQYWSQLGDPVTIQEYGAITSIDICPTDHNIVACTSYNKIQLYNLASVELHKSFTKFPDTVYSGKFRADGGLLCAGTGQGEVKVFDVSAKTLLRVLSGHSAAVQRAAFTFGEAGVVSWSDDKTVKLWDLPTQTALHSLSHHTDYVRAGGVCAEQPDLLASGSYDHQVAVWDRRDLARPTVVMEHGAPVENVFVLPGGGLLASMGGSEVKVWDLVGGGKLLTTLSHHHKTVTCSTLSVDGRCLVTGGLDRQVVWTDISTLSKVCSKHCPASVMSLGIGDRDNYLVVGMLEGQVQIHKRRQEKVEDGMIVDSRRYKKARNHRYLQYTQYTPAQTDTVVSDVRKDIELRHDFLLRKFEYSKALDTVLKPFVARKKPEYTYSLLLELIRRDGLMKALAGRDEKQLCLLLQFVNKYLADQRFSSLCIHVSNLLIDLYLPHHGMSSRVDNLFSDMLRKLDREVNYLETLMELTGAVDIVLSAVTGKHEEPSASAVEHRKSILAEMLHNELHNEEESDSASSEEDEQDQSEDEDDQNEANADRGCEDAADSSSSSNPVSTFKELGVCSWILRQLSCLGISTPSPVQANCIPPILKGRDCVGVAKTGQGKTLAFAIPILQELSVDPYGVFAVVLTPTRELAAQIGDSFSSVGAGMGLRHVVVTGGRDTIRQSQDLARRPHVVVATPGRLADHIRNNSTLSLARVRYLVLDEADRLLSGGFDSDVSSIISALPSSRQTLLFTATNSEAISTVTGSCKNDPFVWSSPDLGITSTVDQLDQRFVLTPPEARDSYLVQLLLSRREEDSKSSSIVFCRTCRDTELIGNLLTKVGLPASILHSMKPQRERMSGLASFKSGLTKVLVATDVASRGLDIPQVSLVVNHSVPRAAVDYVHRVGRTARAGRGGQSVSLVTPHDVGLLLAVEQHTGVKMTELELEDSRVAEIMVQVNMIHREVQLRLENEDWGERRKINERKRKIEQGIDPDLEAKLKKQNLKKRMKQKKKGKLK